jgi:hypothetical protein
MTHTRILKDGSRQNGKLEWLGNCLLVFNDSSVIDTQNQSIEKKLIDGLGRPCMQFIRKKGKVIYFKTTRSANLNILINEGRLIKIKVDPR